MPHTQATTKVACMSKHRNVTPGQSYAPIGNTSSREKKSLAKTRELEDPRRERDDVKADKEDEAEDSGSAGVDEAENEDEVETLGVVVVAAVPRFLRMLRLCLLRAAACCSSTMRLTATTAPAGHEKGH